MKAKPELSRTDDAVVVPQNPNRPECCVRRLRKEISNRRQGSFKIKILSPALRASCDRSSPVLETLPPRPGSRLLDRFLPCLRSSLQLRIYSGLLIAGAWLWVGTHPEVAATAGGAAALPWRRPLGDASAAAPASALRTCTWRATGCTCASGTSSSCAVTMAR